jgi:hypothetical protein
MSEDLRRLIAARGQVKGTITKLFRFVNEPEAKKSTRSEINVKKDRLMKAFVEYCDFNVEISILDTANSEDFSDMEDKYFQALAFFEESERKLAGISSGTSSENACRLPPISLNKFDGEVSSYIDFISLFKSVVDSNSTLSECTKFYHLKALLVGEPASLIQHLQLTAENYSTALQLLDDRYHNTNRLINLHINALLDLKQVVKCTAPALRELISKTKQHVGALKNLEVPTEFWDAILIAILQRKIDSYSLRCYHLELKENTTHNLNLFLNFLAQRASALEMVADGSQQGQPSPPLSNRRASLAAAVGKPALQKRTVLCNFCQSKFHKLYQCEKFKLATVLDRVNHVNKCDLCELCLNKHGSSRCRLLLKCAICKQNHNSLLHQEEASEPVMLPKVSSLSMSRTDNVLLPTIKVGLLDSNGKMIHVRALCDSGSQVSFMRAALATRLGCKLYNESTSFVGVCDSANTVKQKTEVNIYSNTNKVHTKVTCCVIDTITSDLPQFEINRGQINLPPNILLADPEFDDCQPISILLGCDIFFKILRREQLPVIPAELYLHNTSFGYVVAGRVPHGSRVKHPTAGNFCGHVGVQSSGLSDQSDDLAFIMQQFWKCDSVPEIYREATTEQDLAEEIFSKSVVLKNNRFQVDLPLKQSLTDLNMGDSLSRALKRFHNLEKRFEKDPVLFQKYRAFIEEYLSLGHAQYVDISRYDLEGGKVFILPHHPVYSNSKTTHLRVVFDGSMLTSRNISLNDMLLNGPVVQNDLFSILILFRLHRYILIADIQKMFRQTKLNPEHCALQNILWRDSPTESIKCIQLQTVTYGQKSSTFLATRCLVELAQRYKEQYPLAAEVLMNNTYVDDVNTGCNDLKQLIETKCQLTDLLKLGGFALHKWCSNNKQLLEDIPKQLQSMSDIDFCQEEDASIKTLGITYKINSDTLNISSPGGLPCEVESYTKRQVLSVIGKFFDPLGLAGPIVVAAKLIMQRTWQLNIAWDSHIPQDLANEFKSFLHSLNMMQSIPVNRNINTQNLKTAELVGYADASAKAFGCCIYFRTINEDGQVAISLLCSKSRVNPITPLTMPRLELNATLLLATLTRKVRDQITKLGIEIKVHLHSDSQVVLAWLGTEPARLSVYAANRVNQIKEVIKEATWSYVATADNPADCLSRGVEPHMLKDNELWWNGPQCLKDPNHNYSNEFRLPSDLPEMKVCTNAVASNQGVQLLSKYSSIQKLKRIVAIIYRFFNNCKANRANRIFSRVSCKELDSALKVIIRTTQGEHFAQEAQALLCNKPIESNLKKLNPFLDAQGVMRVGGRLQQANLPFYQRHPIILPKRSNITKLIISDEHRISLHASAKIIMGNLSQRYYLADCKRVIKNVVHRCITCFKLKAKASQQLMGSLPADRVTPNRVFSKVGVDFGGPFLIKMHRVRKPVIYKAYIALFVCFTTKAVHIELVSSLTTECFLECLKRFIARRNRPSVIYCDNAQTFKGAQNQLRQLYLLQDSKDHQNAVANFATERGIEFSFVPSYSPVFGGLWEAGIKGAKYHLKRVVGQQVLTYEELNSVVIQVEGVLNSRPLLALQSIDPDEMSYLSPAHFLTGTSLSTYPEPDVTEVPINRLAFWKQCTRMMQSFWKEWSRLYLTQLQSRPKWHKSVPNIDKGTLVLIRDNNAPPLTWQTARVVETFPGPDGKVRALSVKTARGSIIRTSVMKVSVLPINDEN